jgi:hypothetical protein
VLDTVTAKQVVGCAAFKHYTLPFFFELWQQLPLASIMFAVEHLHHTGIPHITVF